MTLLEIVKHFADLVDIYLAVKGYIDETKKDQKIKDNLQAIAGAFHEKDASKLHAIFNDELPESKN